MNRQQNVELIWVKRGGDIECLVRPLPSSGESVGWPVTAQVPGSGLHLPIRSGAVQDPVLYRFPTYLTIDNHIATLGPVFAILAGEGKDGFTGARLNFRDILEEGRKERTFVYVIPTNLVNDSDVWYGYVRVGHKRWLRLPCPSPQAVYNRIPNRALERRPSASRARQVLLRRKVPLFNPEYFSKSKIYEMVTASGLGKHLPDTTPYLDETVVTNMLRKHSALYLKPSGGSVGHGMIRIAEGKSCWSVSVLKNGITSHYACSTLGQVWETVTRVRVKGAYVAQQAIPLLEHHGKPCDFRVLLQKYGNDWTMVGRGVRVSGPGKITTHVPSGGSIANATTVLTQRFGDRARHVDAELEHFVTNAAAAIDAAYLGQLGEMSMDIGIDAQGKPWFFEANAKPMKFDEPDIREKSLKGILRHLRERAGVLEAK